MKVYIVTNSTPDSVFISKSKAKKYLSQQGYRLRKGFYCLDKEINKEFDLIISEREVE